MGFYQCSSNSWFLWWQHSAEPGVLPRSGGFREHLTFSAHQFCTYHPSSTNKHCWGIRVCYVWGIWYTLRMGDMIHVYISKYLVFKALTESFNWNENHMEMDTGGSREHCSSSSQDFQRCGVLPGTYQSLLSLKSLPDEFREHWLQSEQNVNLNMFLYFKDIFKYVLKLATCTYKEDTFDWKTNF